MDDKHSFKCFSFFFKNPIIAKELKKINFNDYIDYSWLSNDWEELQKKIKQIFKNGKSSNIDKIFYRENKQYDSKIIYNNLQKKLKAKGVIFCSLEDAIKSYPMIVKKYFAKLMKINMLLFIQLYDRVNCSFIFRKM